MVFYPCARTCMVNLCAKFEVSSFICFRTRKGDAKFAKCSGLDDLYPAFDMLEIIRPQLGRFVVVGVPGADEGKQALDINMKIYMCTVIIE